MDETISKAVLEAVEEVKQQRERTLVAVICHLLVVYAALFSLIILHSVGDYSDLTVTNGTWVTAVLAVIFHTTIHLKARG